MKRSILFAVVAAATCVLLTPSAGSLWGAPGVDTEDDLQARIQREQDPVRKAKYQIRLAHLKLFRGEPACQQDNHEVCHQMLAVYLDLMKAAWNGLESSGRIAARQPGGFKELETALREDARDLRDSERRIPFEDRDYIDGVVRDINALHDKLFASLFPGGARSKGDKPAPPPGAHFSVGGAR